jgi:hypothetical protein
VVASRYVLRGLIIKKVSYANNVLIRPFLWRPTSFLTLCNVTLSGSVVLSWLQPTSSTKSATPRPSTTKLAPASAVTTLSSEPSAKSRSVFRFRSAWVNFFKTKENCTVF